MVTTKVFKSQQSQAVRLPKEVAFPADVREVSIITMGEYRVIAPVNTTSPLAQSWDEWFDMGPLADDCMLERHQTEHCFSGRKIKQSYCQ